MKKIVHIIALVYFIIFANILPVNSQGLSSMDSVYLKYREKKAERYFENMAYMKAVESYEELIMKGYQTDSMTRNLALAYYKLSNTKKSEDLFRELINRNKQTRTDIYFYIQSLKYNKKYDEADLWLDKYLANNSSDAWAQKQKGTSLFIKKLMEQERYVINIASFNSEYADFGAVENDGNIYFSSARHDQSIIRFEDAWKQAPYLALYLVKNEDASALRAQFLARKFNTVFNDGPVCFNQAGDEIFVTRNNYRYKIPKKGKEGMNYLKIMYAKKNMIGVWSSLEELPFNNNDYSCGHASLSDNGKTLYFTSDMPGGFGGTDIYCVTRTDSGWSKPVNMGSDINTQGDEMFPFVAGDRYLYFTSNGQQGMGGLDLFISRKNKDGAYSVKNMGYPINSSSDDFGLFLKSDGVNGFFSSNRPDGKGDDDIYHVLITNPVGFSFDLEGTVNDSITHEKLDNSTVELQNVDGKTLQVLNTEALNEFNFEIDKEEQYRLKVSRTGYFPEFVWIDPSKIKAENDVIHLPVLLNKKIVYGIYGNIYVKGTPEIVPDIRVRLVSPTGEILSDSITEGNREFRIKLSPETDYQIIFSKESFLTKRAYYSTKGKEQGYVNINDFVEVAVQKLELGAIVEIPNIYYDLAKWNIRADAAIELDKVVQFLNDNPTIIVELGSHTDSRGSDKSNQTLSQKRAQSAVEYIVAKGIESKRIKAKGYGETKIKNRCTNGVQCTEEEHQQNRRTEILVTGF